MCLRRGCSRAAIQSGLTLWAALPSSPSHSTWVGSGQTENASPLCFPYSRAPEAQLGARGAALCSLMGAGPSSPLSPPSPPPPPAVCCWPWLPGCSGGAVGRWLQLMVIAPHPQRGPRGRPTASDLIHASARDACGAGGMWGRGGELRAHRCAPWHRAFLVALRVPASGAVMATRCPPTPGL